MNNQPAAPPGNALRALVTAAAIVVVVAGLQAAGDILLPLLFSVFLSILALPLLRGLKRLHVPNALAILIVVLVVAGILLTVTGIVAGTVRSFTAQIGKYEGPLEELLRTSLDQLELLGIEPEAKDITEILAPSAVMGLVGQTLNALLGVASRLVIVTVTLSFILLEASELAKKISVAFGPDGSVGGALGQAGDKVQRYLLIKTIVSAATGVLAGVWVHALGLDFPVMWGLLAFLLNYIPSIGSIVASIPPILLAIVQLGVPHAAAVGAGYVMINLALGNFIEPRLLGRNLGLSPLVVFLSLLFWGWVWGPVGMLFSVPMTVIAKLVLEVNEDTRWIAILLGSARDIDGWVASADTMTPPTGR
jgi:AI-2 transport protein TqsA